MYCRVLQTYPGMQPDLTCIISNGPRSEWVNGSSLFGQLSGGYVFKIACDQARKYHFSSVLTYRLVSSSCDILQTIGSHIPYECAIGMNGFVGILQRTHK